MRKYPKIKYPNDEEARGVFAKGDIVIQEKLDGGNFRFTHERNLDEEYHTDSRDIVFGSRNVQFKNVRDENKQFERPMNYIRENVNPQHILDVEDWYDGRLTFFGEAMTPHTLEYDWEETPGFVGFDVYDEASGRWLNHTELERAFEHLGLPTAEIVDIVSAEAWDDYEVEVPQSEYGEVEAEGLTFKNYETQTFSKFVRDDFKEKNKKTFGGGGGNPNKEPSGAEKLSYQYVTNARIEKNAHKMVDEGPFESLKMEMMQPTDGHDGLPQAVIRDMAEEEGVNIFLNERWEVDIGEFRSITASRCAAVLKQMIQKRAVEEL
ncbi:RNA ligase [Halogranum tailed virus 1]|uniref:RNA ligase n=1 Tax=Halogranum tailed virus 1 TaxID=1273749 RepID=R4T716_9CAUD|nr:RNA ligase [Halogranum tailed virus 1]AGM11514.1 RNA ligase [Halogranum tailed virus 1]